MSFSTFRKLTQAHAQAKANLLKIASALANLGFVYFETKINKAWYVLVKNSKLWREYRPITLLGRQVNEFTPNIERL